MFFNMKTVVFKPDFITRLFDNYISNLLKHINIPDSLKWESKYSATEHHNHYNDIVMY